MPSVSFTSNLNRHLECPPRDVAGTSVCEALQLVFRDNPRLRSYILDEHGRLRQHVVVFVDGKSIADRERLTDPVSDGQAIFVMQALSGG